MEGVAGGATAPKKPSLLRGGMILCWIYAIVLTLYFALYPQMEKLAVRDTSTGPAVPMKLDAEFLSSTRIFIVPLLVISIIVAYGLAKDRHWSRGMMMLLLILGVALVPPQMANATDYLISLAVAVFGWWYLYRKPNVVEYYRAIRKSN